eukprot:IDg15838t1
MPAAFSHPSMDSLYSRGICPTDEPHPRSADAHAIPRGNIEPARRRCATSHAPEFASSPPLRKSALRKDGAITTVAPSPRTVDDCGMTVVVAPKWAWSRVTSAPEDPILHVVELFRTDPSPHKVNLSVGAYRDAQGRPTELRCIAQASRRIEQRAPDHAYLPLSGHSALVTGATSLVFADAVPASQVAAVQSLSGSGALRIALELCQKTMDARVALLSRPTWPNHSAMAVEAGLEVREYAYYDTARHTVDARAMVAALDAAPRGAV